MIVTLAVTAVGVVRRLARLLPAQPVARACRGRCSRRLSLPGPRYYVDRAVRLALRAANQMVEHGSSTATSRRRRRLHGRRHRQADPHEQQPAAGHRRPATCATTPSAFCSAPSAGRLLHRGRALDDACIAGDKRARHSRCCRIILFLPAVVAVAHRAVGFGTDAQARMASFA